MDPFSHEQLRVLGVLIEKESTTPEQYPLTLNGLLAGCNQTSNRTPVVSYGSSDVEPVLAELRSRGVLRVVHSPSNRAEKYRHVAGDAWELGPGELAVLAVLALRGPQTVNELRTRTERYHGLDDLGGVEGVLHRLKNRYDDPWVTRLERQPGQREERWAHLLAGDVVAEVTVDVDDPPGDEEEGKGLRRSTSTRLSDLEAQVAMLTDAVDQLTEELQTVQELLG